MNDILQRIVEKDDKAAYEYTKELAVQSAQSDQYLFLIPELAGLLEHRSSYVRTRAFHLICCQARWDEDGQIMEVFENMSRLLYDAKPTVVRQCLKSLYELWMYRPQMKGVILTAVEKIDCANYKESMAALIEKDVKELLKKMEQ